jgi:hypothetical protein
MMDPVHIKAMGLSILGPGGIGEMPVRTGFQIGPGDVFVALLLVYVLAYLYLLEPVDLPVDHKRRIRLLLLAVAVPLAVTFLGVLLFTIFDRDVLLIVTPVVG